MPLHQLAGPGLSPLSDPDPLLPAPFFERWLLQDPVPTAIVLCVIAALGWWVLQRSGKVKASWAALVAGPVLVGGVLLLANLVVTQREALVARAAALVDDTINARADAVEPVLRSDLTLTLLSRRTDVSRARVVDYIRNDTAGKSYQTRPSYLKWATATFDGPNVARTQCRVILSVNDNWFPSTWMIHWARDNPSSPWQVRMIDAQQIGFMPQNSIGGI